MGSPSQNLHLCKSHEVPRTGVSRQLRGEHWAGVHLVHTTLTTTSSHHTHAEPKTSPIGGKISVDIFAKYNLKVENNNNSEIFFCDVYNNVVCFVWIITWLCPALIRQNCSILMSSPLMFSHKNCLSSLCRFHEKLPDPTCGALTITQH